MARKHLSKHPDFVKFVADGVKADLAKGNTATDRDVIEFFGLDKSEEKRRLEHNKAMRDLYAEMKSPEGRGILLEYPNGPDQFFEDVESGVYDD